MCSAQTENKPVYIYKAAKGRQHVGQSKTLKLILKSSTFQMLGYYM